MATTVSLPATPHREPSHSYESGVWSWLATTDHKRIGQLYLYTSLLWFLIGGIEAAIIRTQLFGPNQHLVTAQTYNELFTMHGTTMIFLVVMPLSAAFFNFLIPLQIGARDVAFPRLNAFSYWVFLFGGLFINFSWFLHAAPNAGWFGYAPLTTRPFSPGLNIDFWVIGLQILGISSLAAGFNFITTIINMRAPGHALHAHADLLVDGVRHAVPDHPRLPDHHGRADVPDVRPLLRHELLRDLRPARIRCSGSISSGCSDIRRCTS